MVPSSSLNSGPLKELGPQQPIGTYLLKKGIIEGYGHVNHSLDKASGKLS